jgi:hypothetical protein
LNVSYDRSRRITDKINMGDLSEKPGWVRLSLHPTMTDDEVLFVVEALKQVTGKHKKWECDYAYNKRINDFTYIGSKKIPTISDSFFLLD